VIVPARKSSYDKGRASYPGGAAFFIPRMRAARVLPARRPAFVSLPAFFA